MTHPSLCHPGATNLKKPFAAYVERVYLATDFAQLRIGT